MLICTRHFMLKVYYYLIFTTNIRYYYPFFKDEKNEAQEDMKCPLRHTVNKRWIWEFSTPMPNSISETLLSPSQRNLCVIM